MLKNPSFGIGSARFAEAKPLYQRALAIFEKALGPEHPDVATSLNNLVALSVAFSMRK